MVIGEVCFQRENERQSLGNISIVNLYVSDPKYIIKVQNLKITDLFII